MKFNFEYPKPMYIPRDSSDEVFKDFTMFDVSFDSKINYFKNYDTKSGQLVVKLFGFGIRVTW